MVGSEINGEPTHTLSVRARNCLANMGYPQSNRDQIKREIEQGTFLHTKKNAKNCAEQTFIEICRWSGLGAPDRLKAILVMYSDIFGTAVIAVKCTKCRAPMKVKAKVDTAGKPYRYLHALKGKLCSFAVLDDTVSFICSKCSSWVTSKLREEGRVCRFCKTIIYTSEDCSTHYRDNGRRDMYVCTAPSCQEAYRKATVKAIEALERSLEQEKENERILAARKDEWIKTHPKPSFHPIFTEEKKDSDQVLLLVIRSLPPLQYNQFMRKLFYFLEYSSWSCEISSDPQSEAEEFEWIMFFDEEALYDKIELLDDNGEKIDIPADLPLIVWDWIQAGGEPLFAGDRRGP